MAAITNTAHLTESDPVLFIKQMESYSEVGWSIRKVKVNRSPSGDAVSFEGWIEKTKSA